MGRAIQRRSIWCAELSGLFHSSNHVNETDRRNQMNQIPPKRDDMASGTCFFARPSDCGFRDHDA